MLQSETVRKYDTYKDSGLEWIGEIPQNWELLRLQFCLDEIKQKNNPIQSEQVLSLVKDRGVMLYEEKGNVGNVAKEDISEYKLAYPNTLILNSMNILIGSVGISNYFGCVSPVYYVFKEMDKSDLRFINYIFTTCEFQKELRRYANGIMEIRLRVSAQDIFKRKIAFPNKQEQIKIADYLDKKCGEIDRVVETEKLVIEKLKEYKQSIITEAVTKGLNKSVQLKDSGIEYLGNIPSKWNIKRLRYLATCQNGISKSGEYFGEGSPFVSYGDVYNNNVLPETVEGLCMVTETEKENYSVKTNDIFFTRTSETIEEIAITCVCKKTIEDATFAGFLIRVRPYTGELIVDYSKYYFASEIHRKFFVKEMNLVTRASLSQELLKKLPVLIPPKEEQQQIAEYLDNKCSEIDKAIVDKEQVIEKFTEYKKSLIYECVTGKKRVA